MDNFYLNDGGWLGPGEALAPEEVGPQVEVEWPKFSALDDAAGRVQDAERIDGLVLVVGAALQQPVVQHLQEQQSYGL